MDNKEKSIEELCEAFDKIIGSDNEAVQRMFRHLLTLVELTDQNHDENKSLTGLGLRNKGPFGSLFDRLDQLERIWHRCRCLQFRHYLSMIFPYLCQIQIQIQTPCLLTRLTKNSFLIYNSDMLFTSGF